MGAPLIVVYVVLTAAPVVEAEWPTDLVLLAAATTLHLAIDAGVGAEHAGQAPSCAPAGGVCDRKQVPEFDRPAIDQDSPAARAAGDAVLATLGVAAVAASLIDVRREHEEWAYAAVVEGVLLGQAAALSLALSSALAVAVERPRPYLYGLTASSQARTAARAELSFPSRETALAFGLAAAASALYIEHWGDHWSSWAVTAGSFAAASAVGLLRVEGGEAFYTDAIAGAAIGAAVGWLVVSAHVPDAGDPVLAPVAYREGGGGLALTGLF